MRTGAQIERVVQVHTRYRQPGGEEAVVEAERRLLEAAGVTVRQLLFDNAAIRESVSPLSDLRLAGSAIWSRSAEQRVRAVVRSFRPDVVHVHNWFSAASPAVLAAPAKLGVPVVHTLHNYRPACPSATAFRDGRPCTDCVGRFIPWPGVVHACVRGSHAQSLAIAAAITVHRARRTYSRDVTTYIALSNFQRRVMIRAGLPPSRIRVVGNHVEPDPGERIGRRRGVVFVGRLSAEKGIDSLLRAAADVDGAVQIIGSGPYQPTVERAAASGLITYRGPMARASAIDAIGDASAVVVPSIWFEGFPLVVIEAFATGTPVIASRIGSLGEIVEDGMTGLLVDPDDPAQLADRLRWALDHPDEMRRLGRSARERYEQRYRGSIHLSALLDAYEAAVASRHERSRKRDVSGRAQ